MGKRPVGRPKKKIDYDTVDKLASIMCTQEEIASFLDISVRTLQRDEEFCRVFKKGIEKGKISLRRTQFRIADNHAGMAIFLGKQYLGQRDRVAVDETKFDKLDELIQGLDDLAGV